MRTDLDRWRDGVDTDISDLQREFVDAASTMREIREWMRSHERDHQLDRTDRSRQPDDIRGWVTLAIAVLSMLVALGIIKPG